MFTGIIRDVGRVEAIAMRDETRVLEISTNLDLSEASLGASYAINGVCLTLVKKSREENETNTTETRSSWRFGVELGPETLAVTTLGKLASGAMVNIEPALKMGQALDGHWVQGHVDGIATLSSVELDADSIVWTLHVEAERYLPYLVPKGSITLEGASLTINSVEGHDFSVTLIPHTLQETTFSGLGVGDKLNFETDIMARQIERLLNYRTSQQCNPPQA